MQCERIAIPVRNTSSSPLNDRDKGAKIKGVQTGIDTYVKAAVGHSTVSHTTATIDTPLHRVTQALKPL